MHADGSPALRHPLFEIRDFLVGHSVSLGDHGDQIDLGV